MSHAPKPLLARLTPWLACSAIAQEPATQVAAPVELYDRDPDQPLNAERTEFEATGEATVYHVLVDSTNGERVPMLLTIPKAGEGPFPVVMLQHGLGGDKNAGYIALSQARRPGRAPAH
jgi:predicted dienelactone hydrolase